MHKKEHHAQQPEIRDAHRRHSPVEEFRQVKTHDQQNGERTQQIEVG
jgi:hypothetical protein